MSEDKSEKRAKSGKGKRLVMVLVISLVMLGLGGGGAYALVKSGMIGGERAKVDNSPKLLKKGDADPYAPKADSKDESGNDVDGDGGSPYKTSYFNFSDEFTSNLKGSSTLIQVSLACSTHRDGRVIMWLKKHELAIRSDMLEVLADTPDDDIDSLEGKQRLRKRLTAAINHVLIQTEGFGGVDDVYFKNFLVQ